MPHASSAVVFLRKSSAKINFVEQCFVSDVLVWWNGGLQGPISQ
jgi:hypothetical protein